jgi:hypothetical protein
VSVVPWGVYARPCLQRSDPDDDGGELAIGRKLGLFAQMLLLGEETVAVAFGERPHQRMFRLVRTLKSDSDPYLRLLLLGGGVEVGKR